MSCISKGETLHVGDVIGGGTVGGGCGLELGRYPELGQTVELEIEGLGAPRTASSTGRACEGAQCAAVLFTIAW